MNYGVRGPRFEPGDLINFNSRFLHFFRAPPYLRFGKTDAIFVDALHSDYGFIGINYIGGDADFFPNGGTGAQPACRSLFSFITKWFSKYRKFS